MSTHNEAIHMQQFLQAVRQAGLQPPDTIATEEFVRFPGRGKSAGNQAGWCILFNNYLAGAFGDWSSGYKQVWRSQGYQCLTLQEQRALTVKIHQAQSLRNAQRASHQQKATVRATTIWQQSQPVDISHPYIQRKHIQPYAAKMRNNRLVLPLVDDNNTIHTLHFISEQGNKRFLKNGAKKGHYIVIHGMQPAPARVIICEGWATACTIAEYEPNALVLSAVDTHNLLPVTQHAQQRWPQAEIIIAGDDDRRTAGNPGKTKATAYASELGVKVAFPNWPEDAPTTLTDFNDWHVWYLEHPEAMRQPFMQPIMPALAASMHHENDWPLLVPFNTPAKKSITLTHWPMWFKNYANAVAKHTQTPLELAVSMMLVVSASAVARRVKVQVKPGYYETCNLWIVTALPPGNRKSAVQSAATAPLLEWERQKADELEPMIRDAAARRSMEEARVKHLRNKSASAKTTSDAEPYVNEVMWLH